MKYDFSTKDGLLAKLISYADNPDDDNIRYKQKIKQALIHCPELLYLMHDKELEVELFDEDGNLNVDEDGEPIGDWGAYFGSNSHIRDYLFFPDVQTDSSVYLCYQVSQRHPEGRERVPYRSWIYRTCSFITKIIQMMKLVLRDTI